MRAIRRLSNSAGRTPDTLRCSGRNLITSLARNPLYRTTDRMEVSFRPVEQIILLIDIVRRRIIKTAPPSGKIEICCKPGAPYEVSEISHGHILSTVRVGLKNSGERVVPQFEFGSRPTTRAEARLARRSYSSAIRNIAILASRSLSWPARTRASSARWCQCAGSLMKCVGTTGPPQAAAADRSRFASHASSTSTISLISQRREVTPAAIASVILSVLWMRQKLDAIFGKDRVERSETHQLARRQLDGFGNDSTHPTPCSIQLAAFQ
jgi:hypothetical protein